MERRLAAILAADVVGYTRLMGEDEEGTFQRLTELRQELLEPLIAEHHGRVVKLMGDGLLVEFASVVDSVTCALAWQKDVNKHEADSENDMGLRFRIGINLGDVIVEGDDIHGDGVNIAARLEALAEPGGICLSGDAYRQAKGKLEAEFEDMGEHDLKNVAEPVRVYRVAGSDFTTDATSSVREPLSLPDKPSIAVLPFTNMSGDPEQEYFADGITEDILIALSRFRSLFVIARNSSFTYKGKAVDIKQVGRELGVRYVLEGSVRKAGNRVRITGQLIESDSGGHVWADRYDGELDDIFALQDRIAESVAGVIAPSIERAEIVRARRKPPENLDAYDLYLRALPHFYAMSQPEGEVAMELQRRALALDPTYAPPKYLLASCLTWGAAQGWLPLDKVAREAMLLAEAVVRDDKENADALALLARLTAFLEGRHTDAIGLAEQAISCNANSFTVWSLSGWVHTYAAQPSIAIVHFERAFQLNPRDPMDFDALGGYAIALLQLGRDEEAIDAARRSTQRNPNFSTAWRVLAAGLAQIGSTEEAAAAIERLLQLEPDLTIGGFEARPSFSIQARARYVDGMRKAGLPQ